MVKSQGYGRYSLGIGVHEGFSQVTVSVSDRWLHMLHPLGCEQPGNPIPMDALVASAPDKAMRILIRSICRGVIEAPGEDDLIGLWLGVSRYGVGGRHLDLEPEFVGTAKLTSAGEYTISRLSESK